ncbi:MAG: hypothetical protein IPK18_07310 [Sphingobacteriales bacterium]|jgi:hypothetical protein|nr:MAG: hypothetical protein IPK18_07310 [Sphingobacteriales bacterium]
MKKIILVSILAIVIFATSCKKETETDNPNIIHRTTNLEVRVSSYNAYSSMSIDIDKDSTIDFGLYLQLNKDNNDKYNYLLAIAGEVLHNEMKFISINGDDYIKTLSKNDSINVGSVLDWSFDCNIFEIEKTIGNTEEKYGFYGKENILVGIRFLIGTELHYGWIKLDVASDYKSAIVKEIAYNIRPNIGIKAGEK